MGIAFAAKPGNVRHPMCDSMFTIICPVRGQMFCTCQTWHSWRTYGASNALGSAYGRWWCHTDIPTPGRGGFCRLCQDGKLPALSREKRQDSEWLGRRAARSRKERRHVSAVAPGFCNHAGPHLLERRPARCSPEVTAGFCSTTGPARSSCPTARSPFFAGLKFRLARHRPGSARSG